jgi:hypothetical protein
MFNFMTPVKQMHKGLYFIFTKQELRSNIQMMIKNPEVRNLYNIRKLQLLLDTL